jgi:hypothetical protein
MEVKDSLDITHHRFLWSVEENHIGGDEQQDHSDNIYNSK